MKNSFPQSYPPQSYQAEVQELFGFRRRKFPHVGQYENLRNDAVYYKICAAAHVDTSVT